jgi:hypothetical protein
MTWEEHEREICQEIDFLPPKSETYEICNSWCNAQNCIYYYECFEENHAHLHAVKYKDRYYVVYLSGDEDEIKYKFIR